MAQRLKIIVGISLLAIVLTVVCAAIFTAFKSAFSTINGLGEFTGAFTGAFFAYVFLKISELGTNLQSRQRLHSTSLVTIEQSLNDQINRLYASEFIVNDILQSINQSIKDPEGVPKVNMNYMKNVPFDRSLLIGLRNLDLRNDIFSYYEDLEKLNNSMLTVQRFYDLMTTNLISGQLDKKDYIRNLEEIKNSLLELNKFIAATIEDCVVLAAKTRVVSSYNPVWVTSIINLGPQNYPKDFVEKVKIEKEILDKEMIDNTQVSKVRISHIVN